MPASDRHQQPLRLPREVALQAQRQAKRRGISFNAYVLGSLETRLSADKDRPEERRAPKEKDAPRGLGLRLLSRPPAAEDLPPPPEPAAPVVVNVGAAGPSAAGGDVTSALAAFIRSGPAFDRERRRRTALEVLRAHGQTSAERAALTERLDAALAEPAPARTSLGTGIGSLFR